MSSFRALISEGNVLVDFHATWCGPCKTLAPILKELSSEWGDQIRVIKIDIDRNQSLAQKLSVQGVPTLFFYKNGEAVWRKSGAMPKHILKSEIEAFL